jgi:hypothetical protein
MSSVVALPRIGRSSWIAVAGGSGGKHGRGGPHYDVNATETGDMRSVQATARSDTMAANLDSSRGGNISQCPNF